jgi:hypothetical protein
MVIYIIIGADELSYRDEAAFRLFSQHNRPEAIPTDRYELSSVMDLK